MTTIQTDKGKTFNTHWAWAPAGADGEMMLEYEDTRSLAEIAADWEGVQRFHRINELESEPETDYEGYTRITTVVRDFRKGTVQLTLAKESD